MVRAQVQAVILVATALAVHADTDDWPRYGHDGALSGRSALTGEVTKPQLAWSHSVAGTEYTIELMPSDGQHNVELPPEGNASQPRDDAARKEWEADWDLGPAKLDVDGSGRQQQATESYHERWAKILPDVEGLQRVAWNNTWTTQKVCRLQLFAYDRGIDKPHMVWESDPPEGDIFNPLNVVYDIDGDGVREICVAAHHRVMIFEGTTGRKETELRYHGNRPYGWFGLADVDADGQMELITLGDFQSHFDVLEFDRTRTEAQRLSVRWRRNIETDINARTKWPQIGPLPVGNITGDRCLELAVNLFNDSGDGQWHVQVIDAGSGQSLCDLPGRYLQGIADVDGNGTEELFCCATLGVVVPTLGRIELCAVADGKARVLWAAENSSWMMADLPRLGSLWSTTATGGMKHALVTATTDRQCASWLTWQRAQAAGQTKGDHLDFRLAAHRMNEQGRVLDDWALDGLCEPAEGVAIVRETGEEKPNALIRLTASAGSLMRLDGQKVRPIVVGGRSAAGAMAPPIATRLCRNGPMAVVAEGAGNRVVAIRPPAGEDKPPAVLWQASGRGMTSGSVWTGLAAADLDGDGGSEVLLADEAADGQADLAALRHDGSILWRHRFEGIPGPPPIWNVGGLTFWWPGRFRLPDRNDVFVSVRKSLMHSDVGILLDGRTGSPAWRQEKAIAPGQFDWGYAGSPLATVDVNADGIDELVNLYPVCFWIADGRTGKLIEALELASRKHLPTWAAYGEPVVRDFTGDGQLDVLLDSVYVLALLNLKGLPIWHGIARPDYLAGTPEGNVGETTQVRHCLIDIDGDGAFEVASGGYKNGVRVIDPKDGKVLWALSAPDPTCQKVCAADIDGRRGDELIYPSGNKLIAVTGDRAGGHILWSWQGPASLSMPAIADTDDDGKAEILIRSADGVIHCLE